MMGVAINISMLCRKKRNLLYLVFCLFHIDSFSFKNTITDIKPRLNQSVTSISVANILSRYAYRKIPFNSLISKKMYQEYFNALDPQKLFFLQSDWVEFKKYERQLIDLLKKGYIDVGFQIFSRYRKRHKDFIDYQLAMIDAGLEKLNLEDSEHFILDRKIDIADRFVSQEEQQIIWLQYLKHHIISMKLNHKSLQDIAGILKKRYKNQLSRLNQVTEDEIFQTYINTFTSLHDPHTQYLTPTNAKSFDIEMSLSFEGIGAALREENDYIKVHKIIPGGPAAKKNVLKVGDFIIGVGSGYKGKMEDIIGMRLDHVVKLIRGAKGSVVRLSVISNLQQTKPNIYMFKRDKIKLEEQEAKYDIVSPSIQGKSYKIGVIRIPTFYLDFKALQEKKDNVKSTTKDVEKIIVKLKKEAVDGIIIDIRNNAGGSLQEAIQLTGLFIPNGPAVAVKSLDRVIYHYQNSQSQHLYLGPMLVMVNGLSASASEIFSAAIQDYRRGLIVGQNTYGKGTVQILNPLREGQLKFTIAKFYRVSGESTQCRGVFPDIEFPDLYHQEAIGEKTLPHALPYDTISPITLNYTDDLTQDSLQYLKFQFENNQHNQPYFDYIRAMNTLNHTFFFKKTVSLSFMARQKELQQFRIKHLKIENDYRVKTGKSIFKSYEALEKYIEYRSEKKSKYQIEEDEYVKKSVFLLSHLVHFKHNNIEKTSQN